MIGSAFIFLAVVSSTLGQPETAQSRGLEACIEDIDGVIGGNSTADASTDATVTQCSIIEDIDGVIGGISTGDASTDATVTQCSIWLAPSSLIGHTGFGVFTTRDIKEDETFLSAPDGPSVPVIDYLEGPLREEKEEFANMANQYYWGSVPDHVHHEARHDAIEFQPTLGSLPNHHCVLNTVDERYPKIAYNDAMVDRFKHPGTGAFSYSMGREFFADEDLSAGDEIFMSYGHCTRDQETLEDWPWTANIPMTNDYINAARIAWKYHVSSNGADVDIIAPESANQFVAALLPKSTSHLRSIIELAGDDDEVDSLEDLVPLLAKYMTTTPRSVDWIKKHGMCIENLVPRMSKIPGAGQGGFAQYFVGKGEIVVPAPMLHYVNKDAFMIHSGDSRGENGDEGGSNKWQLLLNYCFGRPDESSLLLCPNTNAILINHCSNRKKQCGPKGPNAQYRWSTGWEPRSDEFRNMTVEEISKQPERGLSMEIVALRDIYPGEEVYMDYGVEWENAWEEHAANWRPPTENRHSFVTAKEANEQEALELLVTGDLRKVQELSHLFTGCLFKPTRIDKSKVWKEENSSWERLEDEELLALYGSDGSIYTGDYQSHTDHDYWPCSVIAQDGADTYTVRIHQTKEHHRELWARNDLPRFLTKYPRESVRYFVHPLDNDQNLPGVFRYPIHIRDEIFPQQWKNIA